MSRWALACACCLVASPGAAEQTDLEPVIVSAARAPQPALTVPTAADSVAARDLHLARPANDLSESLLRIPGVVVRDRENHAQDLQISIRGFGARATFGVRGLRLITDGIPASAPDGQGQVAHFPLDSAARIEVLRGPFSVLHGNAAGGVISLTTADPPATPHLRFGLVAGEDGLRRRALAWHTPWSASDGGLLFDAVDLDDPGYRDHSAATRRSGHLAVNASRGDWHLRLLGNHLDLRADDPQGLTRAQLALDRRAASLGALTFDTRKTVDQDQMGLRIEHEPDAAFDWSLTTWRGQRATTQMLSVPVAAQANPLSGGGALSLDRDYAGQEWRGRWSFADDTSLTLGLSHETSSEERLGFENFIGTTLGVFGALRREETNRVTARAAYAQVAWQPAPDWHAQFGLRRSTVDFASHDRYITVSNPDDSGRLDYAHSAPAFGLLHRITPRLSVYANAGRGFETPTAAELAYRADGTSGLNDSLRPAVSLSLEAGLRRITPRHRQSLAVFRTRTADELVIASSAGGRSVFGNAGETRRQGLEWSADGRLQEAWRYATALTWLDARFQDGVLAGRHLPGLARLSAWGELTWSPRTDTDLLLEARVVSRVYADDANLAHAGSHARLDLAWEQRFTWLTCDWRAWLRVDNLLDRAYIGSVIVNEANGRYFEPAAGRRGSLGLSVTREF